MRFDWPLAPSNGEWPKARELWHQEKSSHKLSQQLYDHKIEFASRHIIGCMVEVWNWLPIDFDSQVADHLHVYAVFNDAAKSDFLILWCYAAVEFMDLMLSCVKEIDLVRRDFEKKVAIGIEDLGGFIIDLMAHK